jgi:hypothetical protein
MVPKLDSAESLDPTVSAPCICQGEVRAATAPAMPDEMPERNKSRSILLGCAGDPGATRESSPGRGRKSRVLIWAPRLSSIERHPRQGTFLRLRN